MLLLLLLLSSCASLSLGEVRSFNCAVYNHHGVYGRGLITARSAEEAEEKAQKEVDELKGQGKLPNEVGVLCREVKQ